jgi:hypothetical protein
MRLTTMCLLVVVSLSGCGRVGYDLLPMTNDGAPGGTGGRTPLADSGTDGHSGGTGGFTGSGGALPGSGGALPGSGGALPGSGGALPGSGGALPGSGGASPDGGEPDAGAPCRSGCTCEFYAGHRYMVCPDTLVFTAARAACESVGMRLVRIDSGAESTFLRLRSQQDTLPKFHIGASDTAAEGRWVWEDGAQFWNGAGAGAPVGGLFAFWATGEPNNQNTNENCAEVQSIQGWNDSVCDAQAKPFICEAYAAQPPGCGNGAVEAGEVCDDARTGQYCNANCTAFTCPPSCQCFASGGRNYALCPTPATFGDAAVACGERRMTLANVGGAPEDQALRSRATTASITEYWIGGTDLDAQNQWMWLDTTRFWTGTSTGTALAYAHFASTAPNGGAARNCLQVLANGEWTDADCSRTLPYVCERFTP